MTHANILARVFRGAALKSAGGVGGYHVVTVSSPNPNALGVFITHDDRRDPIKVMDLDITRHCAHDLCAQIANLLDTDDGPTIARLVLPTAELCEAILRRRALTLQESTGPRP